MRPVCSATGMNSEGEMALSSGVAEAEQRLQAGQLALHGVLRLVDEFEAAVLQGVAQQTFDVVAAREFFAELGGEDLEGVAAQLLGAIHGMVGMDLELAG